MIKINLDENFADKRNYIDKENNIYGVFHSVAEVISKNLKSKANMSISNSGSDISKDIDSILNFLLDKNFYKYTFILSDINGFEINSQEINDFLSLPCNKAISSLLNPKVNTNKEYRCFNEKYKQKDFFKNIEKFLVNKGKLTKELREIFLKTYYPNYEELKNTFSYDHFKEYRTTVMSTMGVTVCPYCNMNYIINFKKSNGDPIATADLDHFYVKSKHPEYALCLYNFIPSCQVCNSRLKGQQDMNIHDHIYPHRDSSEDHIYFKVSNLIETITGKSNPEIKVHTKSAKAEKSSELFEIENRYNVLKPIVKNLLEKAIIYNESYNHELQSLLGVDRIKLEDITLSTCDDDEKQDKIEQLMNSNNIDVKALVFGKKLTEDEMLNESLGKFKMDLLKQFGVFK